MPLDQGEIFSRQAGPVPDDEARLPLIATGMTFQLLFVTRQHFRFGGEQPLEFTFELRARG